MFDPDLLFLLACGMITLGAVLWAIHTQLRYNELQQLFAAIVTNTASPRQKYEAERIAEEIE